MVTPDGPRWITLEHWMINHLLRHDMWRTACGLTELVDVLPADPELANCGSCARSRYYKECHP